MPYWIDSHAHWDVRELMDVASRERILARKAGVVCSVVPAVNVRSFATVRAWAYAQNDAYALGIHPLFAASSAHSDLHILQHQLSTANTDARLVAVGEIGLDGLVAQAKNTEMWEQQQYFFTQQLQLAQTFDLPVIVHSRRAVDAVLHALRRCPPVRAGIAHAFNGSLQQAKMLLDLGFKLGFGGALTYTRALRLHSLVKMLPISAIVLETDTPGMVPSWLYTPAYLRKQGMAQAFNSSKELPRIAKIIAEYRGISVSELQALTLENTLAILPGLHAIYKLHTP